MCAVESVTMRCRSTGFTVILIGSVRVGQEWERNFALLEAFRRREGHADVPPGYKVGGTALRVWLDNQRQRWQAREWSEKTRFYEKRSAMSDEEHARLEALGVRWPRANSRAAVCFR